MTQEQENKLARIINYTHNRFISQEEAWNYTISLINEINGGVIDVEHEDIN